MKASLIWLGTFVLTAVCLFMTGTLIYRLTELARIVLTGRV